MALPHDRVALGIEHVRDAAPPLPPAPSAANILVANPGSIPELTQLAVALAEHRLLRAYVTPVAFPEAGLRKPVAKLLPRVVVRRLERERARRVVPSGVPAARVRTTATAEEAVFTASQRLRLPEAVQGWLVRHRSVVFDRRVAGHHLETDDGAVVASRGASYATFRRARELGIPTVLDYPIAHHESSRRLLEEERKLRPEYADTLQGLDYPPTWLARLNAEIERADYLLVFSEVHRRSFEAAGVPSSRLLLAPLGVDVELFSPSDAAEAEHSGDRFRVLFVGQLTQRKGISYVLDGFQQAQLSNSDLLLVGRRVGRMPRVTDPRVHISPPMPRAMLPAVYRSADAFVFPSLVEGFAQTPLEAMACGLPVVVTENAFGGEVIEDGRNGFIVPIRNADAIAARLRLLGSDPDLRRRMGQAARETATTFTWERYRRTVVRLLMSALAL